MTQGDPLTTACRDIEDLAQKAEKSSGDDADEQLQEVLREIRRRARILRKLVRDTAAQDRVSITHNESQESEGRPGRT